MLSGSKSRPLHQARTPSKSRKPTILAVIVAAVSVSVAHTQDLPADTSFKLRVLSTNDVHSRYASANTLGTSCTQADIPSNCFGGSARHKTVIDRLREEVTNSLLLHAGDEGTLFYNYFKGNATAGVLNALGYGVTTIGNHEVDDGPELLKKVGALHWLHYAYNWRYFQLWPNLLFPGPNPNSPKVIDELEAKGVKRIIALGHNDCGPDMEHAAKTCGLDLIVGGNRSLDVVFDAAGKVTSWEGGPVLVEYALAENPAFAVTVKGWQNDFEVKRCHQEECYLGDFITDAMLDTVRATLIKQDNIENPDKP
ncbi:MAG: Metallo-dependent phosphatase-like protein [Podila humilis]|nr:MAG: Metallo-dependent phosphatase-like protein [Podila humilis]